MIVKTVAFGNWSEAFIENRFQNRINIIFSDDNNRGKTLVVQALLYALGNNPIFPSSFDDYNQYFYIKIKVGRKYVEIMRKQNTFSVLQDGNLTIYDSTSDFKMFFNNHIYKLPRYHYDGQIYHSDLSLFFQLFFLPQDKRNTSNIINPGFTNKEHFIEMVKCIGKEDVKASPDEIKQVKEKIKEFQNKISRLLKRNQFSKMNPDLALRVQPGFSNIIFQQFEIKLREADKQIAGLVNKRNRELSRKVKLESLITELRSLNQNIEIGKIICGDCGSDRIVYQSGDLSFEITNDIVRRQILDSITSQINYRLTLITEYSQEINSLQAKYQELLKESPDEVSDIILYKDVILENINSDLKVSEYQVEISHLEERLKEIDESFNSEIEKGKILINRIISELISNYLKIDPHSEINIDSLFTTMKQTFSGSEGQIFYYAKLVAIAKILKIPFPIIIDSFREGEISTHKEQIMINGLKLLHRQVIITSTLKKQEYSENKYENLDRVNSIDYSDITTNKILSSKYKIEFDKLLKKFNITTASA